MRFDLVIVGEGLFAALCALRMVSVVDPARILCVTDGVGIGGDCPQLLLPDLLGSSARRFVEPYVVMEWDRGTIVRPDSQEDCLQPVWLLDPMQIFADFSDKCPATKVRDGSRGAVLIEGYVILEQDIISCSKQLDLRDAISGATHEAIVSMGYGESFSYPVIIDARGDPVRQFVPIDNDRIIVNIINKSVGSIDDNAINLSQIFPIHRELDSLFR